MLKSRPVPLLRPAKTDEFLPPASRWVTIGGVVLLSGVGLITALMAVLPYRAAVRAAAWVRPDGGLRLVQAASGGTIERLEVEQNQPVRQGDVIARLDRTSLESQKRQTEASLQQLQFQLTQLEAQDRWLGSQIVAQSRSIDQEITVAQAELSRQQQDFGTQQAATQADLAEAEAALAFAQSEMRRFEQLAESGSISQLQLEEKQLAVQIASAQVARTRALLDPSAAPVIIAQERIAQAQSDGQATLSTLNREREALRQERSELQAQILQAQKSLQAIDRSLQATVIRATSDGAILRLNLQNPGQVVEAGQTIAEISPQASPIVVKAAVSPQSIAQIHVGQPAFLQVSACPQAEFGTLRSTVTAISPDVVPALAASDSNQTTPRSPDATAQRFYEVTLQPEQTRLVRGDRQCRLQVGMEAEARIVTQSQSLLQFLLRRARLLGGNAAGN